MRTPDLAAPSGRTNPTTASKRPLGPGTCTTEAAALDTASPCPSLTSPAVVISPQSDWLRNRLAEARGVMAEVPHHPVSLAMLACRVILELGDDADERREALGLLAVLGATRGSTGGAP